jgi:hypothetical protein
LADDNAARIEEATMLMKCYMSQLEAAAEARRAKYQAEREEKTRAESGRRACGSRLWKIG